MARDALTPTSHALTELASNAPPQELFLERSTAHSRADHRETFPEGGTRAWIVVIGSFSIITGTFGLLSSVGLFQAYWQEHQLSAYTSRDIGWISAVNVFLNLFLGVQIGPLFDKHGPRYLVAVGSVVYVASLVVLGQCKKYWQFMLVYGVMSGTASAFLTTTALAVVAHWYVLIPPFLHGTQGAELVRHVLRAGRIFYSRNISQNPY